MEDIYRETVTAIENGANFRIDFQSRSLKVNGRHMIRNGRYDGAPWLPEYGCGDFFTDVEELYRRYKHSIPSERSQSKSRRYFMALPESDLEDGVKAAFSLRRKMLSNALKNMGITSQQAQEWLNLAGIDPKRRGETLSLQDFANLTNTFEKIK